MLIQSFTDAERGALLAAACAVVYTPTNEHFGIVPLEAMAAGNATGTLQDRKVEDTQSIQSSEAGRPRSMFSTKQAAHQSVALVHSV